MLQRDKDYQQGFVIVMLGVRTGSADCRQCRILSPEKFRYRVAVSVVPLGGGECASLGVMIMVKGYGKREGSQGQEVQGEKGEGHGENGGVGGTAGSSETGRPLNSQQQGALVQVGKRGNCDGAG